MRRNPFGALFWLATTLFAVACSGKISAPDATEEVIPQDPPVTDDGGHDAGSDGSTGSDQTPADQSDGNGDPTDGGEAMDDGTAHPPRRAFPTVSIQPGGLAYWDTPYFADALAMGGGWMRFRAGQWGEQVPLWQNPQFDERGSPRYLESDYKLRAIVYGLHVKENRLGLVRGKVTLVWKGEADVRLNGGYEYLASESNGPETGLLVDGRRVYRYRTGQLQWLEVHAIDASRPISELHVWLPHPQDPENRTLEGELFHPLFLARLRDRPWGLARFMDWLETNASPQQDWSDRRLPSHIFQTGVLNPRSPADGYAGDRSTGAAYEHLIVLCNLIGLDLWLNVPHLATDEYVRKLARLVRYGSDGREPYSQPVANPVYPPLREDLRLFIEYSNEIWSWGNAFCQGEWAYRRAQELGISKPAFNARRASQIWSIFQEVFGGSGRLVRVAAVQAGNSGYNTPFLEELRDYGKTLSPPVEPDVVSPTTYFGNGIQDFVYQQSWLDGISEDYWQSELFEQHLQVAFDEWTRRLLSGDAQAGAGPDATGIGGGFPEELHQQALTLFAAPKAIVAYEGGPSIYTNEIEDRDPQKGPLVTRFMESMNRHPRMADVYRIHLEMARSHGLMTHNPFVLVSSWGKYGQWGHLEHLDQDPQQAVKYSFLLKWAAETEKLWHIDQPQGSRPTFSTPHLLEASEAGKPLERLIETIGGEGGRQVKIIGSYLAGGLTVELAGAGGAKISGTPTRDMLSYVFLRVCDDDGDCSWRTFTLKTFGGPGTLIECDFSGENPARHLPWTKTYVVCAGCGWSGWAAGSGIITQDGDNGLFFSVNAPADEAQSTLQLAISEGEYFHATFTPPAGGVDLRRAEVRFTVRRLDYHAPRRFAFFTSIGGLQAGTEVFSSERNGDNEDTEYVFTLPDTPAYQSANTALELRLVPFAAQYGGHRAALLDFKLRLR